MGSGLARRSRVVQQFDQILGYLLQIMRRQT